jgi:hypothetical protein
MDRQVIDQKLESLRRCLVRIQYKFPVHSGDLQTNFDLQDIISTMNMPAPETMGQTFEILAQQKVPPANG